MERIYIFKCENGDSIHIDAKCSKEAAELANGFDIPNCTLHMILAGTERRKYSHAFKADRRASCIHKN